ncbi:MarR family transcriptional regulator [Asanoa siamensis]|uniref:HTH marR-type domain-containing protein n=1 Tax=Asanoa siamensis TaxID=926357 RepID=A0ABQ4CS70_9ACTN|nr:hypothetical protein Asi02nite_36330 [Asanoa siamensis]
MSTNTTAAPTAAETVAAILANHPDGITVRDLATEAGVGQSTAAKAVAAMEAAGTAARTPGPANGNRKSPDLWHPATIEPTDESTPADASDTADEAPSDTDTTGPTDEATHAADAPDTADATLDEAPRDGAGDGEAEAALPVVPVSGAPVAPRQPDLKVLIMAGVLGGHPDGITADAAIGESGLSVAMGDVILAAMEVAGAARRLPTDEDGTELWVIGDGDLATVDPANAPTHTTCPTCGHTRKVRRPSARRASGAGRTGGEINGDGSVKLGKNELRHRVEAFMRDLGARHELTPGMVGRELGGRSPGAVRNAMEKLTIAGVLMLTREAPETYALVDNPPAPTAEVRAFMTPAVVATAPADEATDTDTVPVAA